MIFPSARLLRQAAAVIARQQQTILLLHQEIRQAELEHMRISRDLIEQFLVAIDMPENNDEYRRRLSTSLGFYRDEIAVLEEQVV